MIRRVSNGRQQRLREQSAVARRPQHRVYQGILLRLVRAAGLAGTSLLDAWEAEPEAKAETEAET